MATRKITGFSKGIDIERTDIIIICRSRHTVQSLFALSATGICVNFHVLSPFQTETLNKYVESMHIFLRTTYVIRVISMYRPTPLEDPYVYSKTTFCENSRRKRNRGASIRLKLKLKLSNFQNHKRIASECNSIVILLIVLPLFPSRKTFGC